MSYISLEMKMTCDTLTIDLIFQAGLGNIHSNLFVYSVRNSTSTQLKEEDDEEAT